MNTVRVSPAQPWGWVNSSSPSECVGLGKVRTHLVEAPSLASPSSPSNSHLIQVCLTWCRCRSGAFNQCHLSCFAWFIGRPGFLYCYYSQASVLKRLPSRTIWFQVVRGKMSWLSNKILVLNLTGLSFWYLSDQSHVSQARVWVSLLLNLVLLTTQEIVLWIVLCFVSAAYYY